MKITCISDLHGHYPELSGGDLLLLAGDYTASDRLPQWAEFFSWLKKQDYKKKILVAGNHDNFFESGFPQSEKEAYELREVQSWLLTLKEIKEQDFEYLCDNGTEFEGLKIWGSPWSVWFHGIDPACTAFMGNERFIGKKFNKIPIDTNILITHSPPLSILDSTEIGSLSLLKKTRHMIKHLKLHVFGHIHDAYGTWPYNLPYKANSILFMNASHMDKDYRPVNPPWDIEL